MKQKLKSGDEYDCICARQYYKPPKKGWKSIKNKLNRRLRKEGKQELRGEI